jgi:hypothetical protein
MAALVAGLATADAQQFQVAPEYAITSTGTPTSIAAGDFEGDGLGDDMAVVDTTGTVSIFLNKRDGSATFSAPSTVSVAGGTAPYFLATGSFTHSGQSWKDLVVADSVGHITVLSSSGGAFAITDQEQVSGIALTSMIAIDVNGDGLSDVEVGDANTAGISVLAGAGGGKLNAAVGPFSSGLIGSQPIFLTAGDFTSANQPLPDLGAVTQDGSAAVLQNVGSGGSINFNPGIIVSPTGACGFGGNTQPPVTAAVAGYFEQPSANFAGLADLAIASIPPASANCPPAINILSNYGPPPPFSFSFYYEAEPAAVGQTPVALAVADVNGDQAPDIVMANQSDNSVSVLVNDATGGSSFCLNTGSCQFNPVGEEFGTGSSPTAIAAGNFHLGARQPFPDLAAAHQSDSAGNAITLLSNLGTGRDALGYTIWLGYGASCTYDTQGRSCTNSVKQARSDYVIGQGQAPTAVSVSNFYSNVSTARPDFAVAAQSLPLFFQNSAVTLFENDCNQMSAPPCLKGYFTGILPLSFSSSGNFISMTAADLNGIGYSSIAAMDDTGTINVFLNLGPIGFAPTSQDPITTATSSFVASGIFISGHALNQQDLAVTDNQGNVTVLSNNNDKSGNFTVLPPSSVSASFSSMAAADLNGDGNTDVVAADADTGEIWVFQGPVNPSTGAFANSVRVATNLPSQQQPVSIALGFSQSQLPAYLVAVGQDGTVSLLPNISSGSTISFGTPVVYPPSTTGISGGVTAVTTGDFNLDGSADVAVASAAQGQIPSVWFLPNTSTGGALSLGAAESFLTASTPVALAAADMNGDGIPDLVIVNQGSNTASLLFSNGNSKLPVTISLTSSLNPAGLGQPVTFKATVSSNGGAHMPTGTVQFLDGSTPLGTEPLQGGSAVLTTSTLVTGAHSITAAYSGDVNFNPRTSSPLTQVIEGPPDFAMTISPAGTTISAGNSANFTVKVAPQNAFVGTVTLSCSWTNTPSGTSCQLSPSSLTISSDGTAGASTLTVYTAGSMASTNFDRSWPSRLVYAVFCFGLAPVGFVWSTVSSQRQMTFFSFCLVALLAGILLFEVACGGGGGGQVNPQTGTPTGAYSVVVTATTSGSSGAIQHSSTVTVTVQ